VPLPESPLTIAAASAYLLVILSIGFWAARRTRTSRDFFIAGKRIGLFVTAMATMSAAFSGFVFLGGPGLTYRLGIGSLWIVVPVGFTAGLLCWVVARPLRMLAEVREIYTIPDALFCRYGSRVVSGLAALAIVLGTTAYLGAQMRALGLLLQSIFGLERLLPAIAIGLLVLLIYGVLGGMVAGVYTDVVQGGLMLVAALAVFDRSLRVNGGWQELTRGIAGAEAFGEPFLQPLGLTAVLTAFGFFFIFGVGVLGQPQMLHKFYMLDDVRKLKWMPLVLGGSQTLCLLVWIGIGLAVPALVARGALQPLARADDAAPVFLIGHVPEALAGLLLAAVLAAIMSTADSFMNIGAAALVRDLPSAAGRPVRRELFWSRVAVAVLAVAAALLGWLYDDLIALLGTFAFGTFAAALAPAVAIGLNWRRVTPAAAAASIATGLSLNVLLELLSRQTRFGWFPGSPLAAGALPSAAALAGSFAVLFVVTWFERRGARPGRLDPDVQAALEV
jgi:Na+/proline symporter